MPGTRCIDHSGRHGPNPPGRSVGSIFHRHPSASWRAPTETRYRSQSSSSRGFMRPRRRASSSRVPGLRCPSADAAAVVEPARDLGLHHARALAVGDVGPAVVGRQAVEVHQPRHAVRAGVGQLEQDARHPSSDRGGRPARRSPSRPPPARRARRPASCRAAPSRSRRSRGRPRPRTGSRPRPASARTRRRCRRSRSRRAPSRWAARPGRPTRRRRGSTPFDDTGAPPIGTSAAPG